MVGTFTPVCRAASPMDMPRCVIFALAPLVARESRSAGRSDQGTTFMRPVSESRYLVEGMDCASCAEKIRTAVGRISGVENVSISLIGGTMTVAHGDGEDIQPAIKRQVQRLGYRVRLLEGREGESETDLGNGLEKQGRSPADGHGHHHDDAHHHGGAKGETGWWRRPGLTFTLLYGAALLTAFA